MEAKKYTVGTTGPKIDAFLRSITGKGGFQLKWVVEAAEPIHADIENPDVVVRFSGPDVDLLLANKAEMLLALEQLTMEMLRMTQYEHSMLQFDANDYRALRIEELRLGALTAAEKVKKSHLPFHFSPMTSRERRIIHLTLRNEPAVRSESAGVGPQRQVVVYPSDMPSPPSGGPAPFRPRGRRR